MTSSKVSAGFTDVKALVMQSFISRSQKFRSKGSLCGFYRFFRTEVMQIAYYVYIARYIFTVVKREQ